MFIFIEGYFEQGYGLKLGMSGFVKLFLSGKCFMQVSVEVLKLVKLDVT